MAGRGRLRRMARTRKYRIITRLERLNNRLTRWALRRGRATPLPEDDTGRRSRSLPYQWDAALGRLMGTRPLTIRIDVEP